MKKLLTLTYPKMPNSSASRHGKIPFPVCFVGECFVSLLYRLLLGQQAHTTWDRCSSFSIPNGPFLPDAWSRWSGTPPPGGKWEPAQCMLMSAWRCSLIGWREFQLLCMSAGARAESRGGEHPGPCALRCGASRSTPRLACELGGFPFSLPVVLWS